MGHLYPIILCVVLICVTALTTANNLAVGDACRIIRTGNAGMCKLLEHCIEAKNDLNLNGLLPTKCGYEGFKQIVCCPISKPAVETRAEYESDLSIASQKCKEYSRYVFTNITIHKLSTNANPSTVEIDRCGHKAVPLIVGGTPATLSEFPHSALLGYRQLNGQITWDCGGSLLSTRYVLTAAHCLSTPLTNINVSHVRLGELVLNDELDNATVIDVLVKEIIPNPAYRKSRRYNDIALLKLADKVILSPYIRPICLPTTNLDPEKSIATGWGTDDISGDQSEALLKVVLESYSNTECNEIFQYSLDRKLRKGIVETQLCAGSRSMRRDTCEGDSGGPLQIYHPDIYCMYTQIGVTSFGIGCGTVDFPAVYTRVFNYVEWIANVIWGPGEDE